MAPSLSVVPLRTNLALSMREKLSEPVGCDLFIVRQNGHVNVEVVLNTSGASTEQCISGTTLWWYVDDMSSNKGVPLMYRVAVSNDQFVDHVVLSAIDETT